MDPSDAGEESGERPPSCSGHPQFYDNDDDDIANLTVRRQWGANAQDGTWQYFARRVF